MPLAFLLLRAVRTGLATCELLEAFSGSLVSASQLRRRLLSLLQRVYAEARGREPREVWRMSPALKAELLAAAVLLPQADIDCRARGAPLIVASDASQSAGAAVAAPLPENLSRELTRHSLQKGLWVRLLSPLRALLRARGELQPEDEMPGACMLPA